MEDRGEYPIRKNPRLKGYDYSTPNYYFITICSHDMAPIFGDVGMPTPARKIALRGLRDISAHFPRARVDKCVVMPNHVHCILVLEGDGADVPTIIGQYKSFVSREIRKILPGIKVWQRSYHDVIIRSREQYESHWLYIQTNPQNWEADDLYFRPIMESD